MIQPTPLIWMGDYQGLPDSEWRVGWAFFWDSSFGDLNPAFDHSIRQPITVLCPYMLHWTDGSKPDRLGCTPFCIDKLSTESRKPWDVTVDMSTLVIGQKPMITVSPSIHLIGIWHGWLQEGILHN